MAGESRVVKRSPLKSGKPLQRRSRLRSDRFKRYRTPEWQEVRFIVINRDGFCQGCGASNLSLQAHHKSYENGDDPLLMQALCRDCHRSLGNHPRGGIAFDWGNQEVVVDHCPQCSGLDFAESPEGGLGCGVCDWSDRTIRLLTGKPVRLRWTTPE